LPVARQVSRAQLRREPRADSALRRHAQLAARALLRRDGMVQLLASLALLFSLADHWTTYLCLRAHVVGWEVSEANPLAEWLFQRFGLAEGLWIDTLVTALVLGFMVRTQRIAQPAKLAALGVLVATTAYAVANNLQAVQQLGLSLTGTAR
jgi:hypothetical protein